MAKSPLAKNSKTVKHVSNSKNVVSLRLTIPYKDTIGREVTEFDISHLLHLGADSNNVRIEDRITFLRRFCEMANKYVGNGKSAKTVTHSYNSLRTYVAFCDAVGVDPFSETGYLKYAGNDGELRHRIKMYKPSKKLWEMNDGDEIGIKETTAACAVSFLRHSLNWCGLPSFTWANKHRGFFSEKSPYRGYSAEEEELLITRLSDFFFTLAPQLIAAKKEGMTLPAELPFMIRFGEHHEIVSIQTTLEASGGTKNKTHTSAKNNGAFNLVMGAAYNLMCFFTSLNDSNVKSIAHPITIHTDERDKSLRVVKVTSFKARANKEVDAVLTNQSFDIDKRDGVTFIKMLETLSSLYGGGEEGSELMFSLNNLGEKNHSFDLKEINKHLMVKLNLLSPARAGCLPWFKELFYSYRNQHLIQLKTETNKQNRTVVSKIARPISKYNAAVGLTKAAYCILSCFTNLSLKEILLPLTYSQKDADGNINVSFNYKNGQSNNISIPASEIGLIKDIEKFATQRADRQYRSYERFLLTLGGSRTPPRSWNGISPVSPSQMSKWSIEPGEYFISLQSSRWREMTSNEVFSRSGSSGVKSVLQNTLATIYKHYSNGDPRRNKVVVSQALQVMEQLNEDNDLETSKETVATNLGINVLTHDEARIMQGKDKVTTNSNGIACDGRQRIVGGKNTQVKTNNAMNLQLPCAEFDMCYKCQSARAVDETQSIYKLISYIDVLKEALNLYPAVQQEDAHDRIATCEWTLDGASTHVYEEAMSLFNKNGRHPRVSIDHAILTLRHR
ncbi:hypothetical protein [Enterovibrio norvegicus]|uniref:hypothetical protein n=1 Tax=Enterovibrio norvegicus TaxID=188144 RepID=UPI00352E48AB